MLDIGEKQARDGERLQVFDRRDFVPAAAAERGVVRLEGPGDEGGEAAGFFLQVVDVLEVIDPVLQLLAAAEHHGGGGAHAELMRGAVDAQPVFGEALQAGDFVAHFVVEDFGAAAGDGVEAGIAQARDGVAQRRAR